MTYVYVLIVISGRTLAPWQHHLQSPAAVAYTTRSACESTAKRMNAESPDPRGAFICEAVPVAKDGAP
jgi:hypothetical protein